jgi:hypothetical protein
VITGRNRAGKNIISVLRYKKIKGKSLKKGHSSPKGREFPWSSKGG